MKRTIAIVFTVLAILSVGVGLIAGWGNSSGPLNYVFVAIMGLPWTAIISWLFPSVSSPSIPTLGLIINLLLVWWWASGGSKR
ncbi:MAG: hypothetical protein K1X36_03360 [Pyrinomonadaceae bacterium]|nr:hypothetical protein [Pyrinomonadaceae bacterium]